MEKSSFKGSVYERSPRWSLEGQKRLVVGNHKATSFVVTPEIDRWIEMHIEVPDAQTFS